MIGVIESIPSRLGRGEWRRGDGIEWIDFPHSINLFIKLVGGILDINHILQEYENR